MPRLSAVCVSQLATRAGWEPWKHELRPNGMALAGPFLGTEARARGLVTRRTLRSRHDQVHRDVYVPKGEELTPITRAQAAWLWSGREAIAAGFSAAALYGTQWIDPQLPAKLYRRNGKPVEGIVIHRDELSEDETRRNSRHPGDHAGPHGVRPRPPRPPLASAHRGRRPDERDPAAVIGRPTVSRAA